MKYDIFFISYRESNSEENWERLISFHSNAQRVDNIKGIDTSHLLCNALSNTEKFWTIDGDNWLLCELPEDESILNDENDLIYFNSIDPIDGEVSSIGGIKLWSKNKFINFDMSKGDFCKYATNSSVVNDKILSEHRYNATPYEAWCHSFRHMVKSFSGIIPLIRLQENIRIIEKHKQLNIWSYCGYLDARGYVIECNGDFSKINLINDYDWLEQKYKSSVYVADLKKP